MKAIVIPMTTAQIVAATARLKTQSGIDVAGDQGAVKHAGVTVHYAYDGKNLTLVVVEKPFFLSEGVIDSEIRNWFGPAK